MAQDQPMRCPICRAPMMLEERAFIVEIDGQDVQLEDVPTWVCERCDHVHVDPEVIEAVEDMLEHLDTVAAGEEE